MIQTPLIKLKQHSMKEKGSHGKTEGNVKQTEELLCSLLQPNQWMQYKKMFSLLVCTRYSQGLRSHKTESPLIHFIQERIHNNLLRELQKGLE